MTPLQRVFCATLASQLPYFQLSDPALPCRLEEVYLVYTAEKNRGLTLRLHFLFILAWLVAALKTVSQASDAYAQ